MLNCSDCGWCHLIHATSDEKVCCNDRSEKYNETSSKEEASERGCEEGETRQAIDYHNMTAWEFASKYYM